MLNTFKKLFKVNKEEDKSVDKTVMLSDLHNIIITKLKKFLLLCRIYRITKETN